MSDRNGVPEGVRLAAETAWRTKAILLDRKPEDMTIDEVLDVVLPAALMPGVR